MFSFNPNQEQSWQALADLGVGWVRLQVRMGEYDPEQTALVLRVFDEGYGLWLTLTHRDRSNITNPERLDRDQRGSYPPADAERYQALVRRTIAPLVEHLQAEGKDPGVWLVVQMGNEVIPSDVAPDTP